MKLLAPGEEIAQRALHDCRNAAAQFLAGVEQSGFKQAGKIAGQLFGEGMCDFGGQQGHLCFVDTFGFRFGDRGFPGIQPRSAPVGRRPQLLPAVEVVARSPGGWRRRFGAAVSASRRDPQYRRVRSSVFLREVDEFDFVAAILVELDTCAASLPVGLFHADDFDDAGETREAGRDVGGKVEKPFVLELACRGVVGDDDRGFRQRGELPNTCGMKPVGC